jgi:hypothetical protein
MEESWKTVVKKKQKSIENDEELSSQKIQQPCWFFNTMGCHDKHGNPKPDHDCKYLHVYSPDISRPIHISPTKPCDKFNLEGYCKFNDYCKYSHKNLTQEEWETHYVNIPYGLKQNIQKRQLTEIKQRELESRINILEYKLKSMDEHFEEKFKILFNIYQKNG